MNPSDQDSSVLLPQQRNSRAGIHIRPGSYYWLDFKTGTFILNVRAVILHPIGEKVYAVPQEA